METVISSDGTRIAYDKTGSGPVVILVQGAFSYRRFPGALELAELLSRHFTVINYDRRGRGDSGDTAPYAVEREIEDLDALIGASGGSAYVWGLSSGAVLAMKAAAYGSSIAKLAVYEPPFIVDSTGYLPPADFVQRVTNLIAEGHRDDAVRYFMTKGMGMPGPVALMMRLMPGMWPRLTAVAHTLPYDAKMLEGYVSGSPLGTDPWASVRVPTIVLHGEKSIESLRKAAMNLALVLPNAELRSLQGLSHTNIRMKVIAPVLVEYFCQ